ncbi:MAG: NADH-quinone oxidoreductase subunit H [Bdellovibrionaceae bacterium]|jgi:NADH-quinone oxidoreductase subunit H|nr:NADH-quinone oxidoreductase subunit H [Pseudobdellovibrionaceae bacterium]
MGSDLVEVLINSVKLVLIFLLMVQLVPILVWVERRGSAFIQNRYGPNRVGPFGLMQLLADAVKFVFKEEFVPGKGHKLIFYAAPVVALIPGALAFAAIPLANTFHLEPFMFLGESWGPYDINFQGYNVGIGIVFILGVSSLGAYALLLAGWGSANKYSLYGALRAVAQMISYELALGLSIVGAILVYNTFDFHSIIAQQAGALSFTISGRELGIPFLPNWGIFYQPLGAFLFLVAAFAETNRLPFDLPEAESELIAGFHTEYGGMKMLMFYLGEYGHMLVASALLVTFYFGGYQLPFVSHVMIEDMLKSFGLGINMANVLTAFLFFTVFMIKCLIFLWIYVWVRWTLPRFRYDQLMDLGWKTMLPWALANTIVTAVVVFLARI